MKTSPSLIAKPRRRNGLSRHLAGAAVSCVLALLAAGCEGSSGAGRSELTSEQAALTVPVTIDAASMPIKTTGTEAAPGWMLWSNGYIATHAQFPAAGSYHFDIVAKGDWADGAWPQAEIRIDQTAVGWFTVVSPSYGAFAVTANVPSAGVHEVAVAFTNDYYQPPVDRNLYVQSVAISLSSPAGDSGMAQGRCADDAVSTESSGAKLFVAPWGDDGNEGSEASPFATITRATQGAGPGTVVTLAGGTYWLAKGQKIAARGTASAPVIVRSAPGASVTLDAGRLSAWAEPVSFEAASYVVLDGVEIRNSAGYGVNIHGSDHVTVQHCSIHDIRYDAVLASGTDVSVIDNEMYNLVLSNKYGSGNGAWSCGVKTWPQDGVGVSRNFLVSGNRIHDVWGECVDALFVDGATIRGNEIHNCYSMSIYLDHARNVTIDRNYVYADSDAYNRVDSHTRAQGIGMAVEPYPGSMPGPFGLDNITIKNNLVVGTNSGVQYWYGVSSPKNSYSNLHVVNNTFADMTGGGVILMDRVSGGGTPRNAVFANNIALGNAFVGDPAAWEFANNDWGVGGVPYGVQGPGNLTVDPGFVSPAGAGSDPKGYRVRAGSAVAGAGQPVPESASDFVCRVRSSSQPTLGFLESE